MSIPYTKAENMNDGFESQKNQEGHDMLFARVTNPTAGYKGDQDAVALLIPDNYYPVRDVHMSQSSTGITLVDEGGYYNSVNFTFFKSEVGGGMVEHNIYADPHYNPYMRSPSPYL